jgi:hypothetical protein
MFITISRQIQFKGGMFEESFMMKEKFEEILFDRVNFDFVYNLILPVDQALYLKNLNLWKK